MSLYGAVSLAYGRLEQGFDMNAIFAMLTHSEVALVVLLVIALLAALGGALRWGKSKLTRTAEENLKKDKTKTEFI
jgi:hypothetical protein